MLQLFGIFTTAFIYESILLILTVSVVHSGIILYVNLPLQFIKPLQPSEASRTHMLRNRQPLIGEARVAIMLGCPLCLLWLNHMKTTPGCYKSMTHTSTHIRLAGHIVVFINHNTLWTVPLTVLQLRSNLIQLHLAGRCMDNPFFSSDLYSTSTI